MGNRHKGQRCILGQKIFCNPEIPVTLIPRSQLYLESRISGVKKGHAFKPDSFADRNYVNSRESCFNLVKNDQDCCSDDAVSKEFDESDKAIKNDNIGWRNNKTDNCKHYSEK